MTDKPRINKARIATITIAIVAVIVTVVLVVLAINNAGPGSDKVPDTIEDSFFESNDEKYVVEFNVSTSDSSDFYKANKKYIVYFTKDNSITSMVEYYRYDSPEDAQNAFEEEKDLINNQVGVKKASIKDKYIVVVANEDQYENLTKNNVQQMIQFVNALKDVKIDNNSNTNYIEDSYVVSE